jgi:TPR repeat protein
MLTWSRFACYAALAAGGLGAACAHESNLPPPAPVVLPAASGAPSAAKATAGADPVALYRKACDSGSSDGCNSLGVVYIEGRDGVKVDLAEADRWLARACDLGSPAGCGNLGFRLRGQDEVRAIGLLTKACDGSWWEGCYWLADIYAGSDHEDPPLAVQILTKACKGGHERSCGSLGILYQLGKGVAVDKKKANTLYEGACEADVTFACAFWASAMVAADAAPKDVERARKIFPKGCTDDFPFGCFVYGAACANGQLGDDYVDRAMDLERRACEHGYGDACTLLARWMEQQQK